MRPSTLLLTALALSPLVMSPGCEENCYEIEITPRQNRLDREITFYRKDVKALDDGAVQTIYVPMPEDELSKASAPYRRQLATSDPNIHRYSGTFVGHTPGDVGGAGYHKYVSTQMGSASLYMERFRGNDDLSGQLIRSFKAADRLTDMLLGWLRSEIAPYGTLNKYGRLMQFIDTKLRRDIKNLSVYMWTGKIRQAWETDGREDLAVRVLLYFCEREYLRPEQLPVLLRAVQAEGGGLNARALEIVRDIVASKAGLDPSGPLDEPLAFLATPESLVGSMNAYLRTTAEYRALMAKWQRDKRQSPDQAPSKAPEPTDALEMIVSDLIGIHPSGPGAASVSVKLNLTVKPVYTNAEKAENQPAVYQWSSAISGRTSDRTSGLPPVCYAVWAEPDEQFQKAHFGKIVFHDEDLVEYCLWHLGLGDSERRQWDEFARSLAPDQDLLKRLEAFRFDNEKTPDEGHKESPESHAAKIIARIAKSLEGSAEQTSPASPTP